MCFYYFSSFHIFRVMSSSFDQCFLSLCVARTVFVLLYCVNPIHFQWPCPRVLRLFFRMIKSIDLQLLCTRETFRTVMTVWQCVVRRFTSIQMAWHWIMNKIYDWITHILCVWSSRQNCVYECSDCCLWWCGLLDAARCIAALCIFLYGHRSTPSLATMYDI